MRSNGYRRRTRSRFSKDFGKKGMPNPSRTLHKFKIGDMVDCRVDPSVVKGMPHKTYHGYTGIVFNSNPRSYGVIFYKKVGGKYVEKQVHIREEHLWKSRCNEDDIKRWNEYRRVLEEARAAGVKPDLSGLKRMPEGPRQPMCISKVGNDIIEVVPKCKVDIY